MLCIQQVVQHVCNVIWSSSSHMISADAGITKVTVLVSVHRDQRVLPPLPRKISLFCLPGRDQTSGECQPLPHGMIGSGLSDTNSDRLQPHTTPSILISSQDPSAASSIPGCAQSQIPTQIPIPPNFFFRQERETPISKICRHWTHPLKRRIKP